MNRIEIDPLIANELICRLSVEYRTVKYFSVMDFWWDWYVVLWTW